MEQDQRQRLEGHHVYLTVSEGGEQYLYSLGTHNAELEERMSQKNDGFVIKSGEVVTASGHRFYALLEVCAPDSYEHYSTGVVVPGLSRGRGAAGSLPRGGFVQDPTSGEEGGPGPLAVSVLWQGDADFMDWVATAKKQDPSFEFFPYRYLYYDDSGRERDHHVGPDGWSS